ncbi:hypothetical protein [Arthrobacter sp. StoSoilB13]|uniref:hypothetical protein n=1 Tax=Arthrobacter sp. StoSoilB13 TaxID=2830993 RepID=UPI001CC69F36|nr:hypothetical protein [Arthrobacter sp. StoSoilB13]
MFGDQRVDGLNWCGVGRTGNKTEAGVFDDAAFNTVVGPGPGLSAGLFAAAS